MPEVKKSTHRVDVVRITEIEKHPNAERLGVTHVFGYVTCIALNQFKVGDLVAYVVPDSVVPLDRPEFAFLKDPKKPERTSERIRVKRLRGILSQGLLVPAPAGSKEGDDVSDILGVTRYEPPVEQISGGEVESPPSIPVPKYDVEDWHKFGRLFVDGEEVVGTEKLDGANSRFVWHEDRIWVASKNEWKKNDPRSIWWKALQDSPWLEVFCKTHPGVVVYGEAYGNVQDLRYGVPKGKGDVHLMVFDIWDKCRYMDFDEARAAGKDFVWVPLIYRGPYDGKKLKELSNGKSTVAGADHAREGIVVKPVKERYNDEVGRMQLKIVSDDYLEKGG